MLLGSDLDFDGNKAKNLVLHQAATAALDAALTVLGQFGYDTTLQRAKLYDGTTVRKLLQDNDIDPSQTLGGGSASDLVVASQKAVKIYVDTLITQGQTAFIDFDASTETQLPAGATLASRYRVTVGGTVQGVKLQAMDIFVPRVASPSRTTASDWVFTQGNADEATTSVLGMVLLATLAQIQGNAGGDANRVITVAQLNAWEAALGRIKGYTTTLNIVVGANGINHNLGSTAVVVQCYDANDQIAYTTTRPNGNSVSLSAAKARNNVTVTVLAK